MRRVSPSWVAVALAGAALFVSLGGPAWAAGLLVGTKQLKNNAVTSRKIKNGNVRNRDYAPNSISAGKLRTASVTDTKLADASVTTGKLADAAVTTGKLADDAVTSAKVADNSLTATDVAPNTFLPFNGTAQSANSVGGFTADQLAQQTSATHVSVLTGQERRILTIPTGFLDARCPGGKPGIRYENASTPVDYGEEDNNGTTSHFTTQNAIGSNGGDTVNSTTGLQRVTFQIGSTSDRRLTTAITTGHSAGGLVCIFTAQAFSTG